MMRTPPRLSILSTAWILATSWTLISMTPSAPPPSSLGGEDRANGNYHVKDWEGQTWDTEITLDADGDLQGGGTLGSYESRNSEGLLIDYGDVLVTDDDGCLTIVFHSLPSGWQGHIIENENHKGFFNWFANNNDEPLAADGGFAVKK